MPLQLDDLLVALRHAREGEGHLRGQHVAVSRGVGRGEEGWVGGGRDWLARRESEWLGRRERGFWGGGHGAWPSRCGFVHWSFCSDRGPCACDARSLQDSLVLMIH
jgi:hypothetical protein